MGRNKTTGVKLKKHCSLCRSVFDSHSSELLCTLNGASQCTAIYQPRHSASVADAEPAELCRRFAHCLQCEETSAQGSRRHVVCVPEFHIGGIGGWRFFGAVV